MESIVDYRNVELSRKELIVLKDVSLKISRGEFVYLIGKVGSGKSTLIKSMYCEIPIENGDATVFGYDLHSIRRKDVPMLRRKIGIVFQDFQLLTARYTTTCCLCSGQPAGATSGKSTSALRQY